MTSSILKNTAFAFSILLFTTCGRSNEDISEDFPPGEAGTSEAIIKGKNTLATPRPAPIGDTAVNEEQANQFGKLPSNVDSMERADQSLKNRSGRPFD